MIGGSQPNGLPTGTQRYDPTGNDALYKMNMLGSGLLGIHKQEHLTHLIQEAKKILKPWNKKE